MIEQEAKHKLANPPEATFFVVRDSKTNKIHVAKSAWAYDLGDPNRADDIAVLMGYLNNNAERVDAARMIIAMLGTMQTIHAKD